MSEVDQEADSDDAIFNKYVLGSPWSAKDFDTSSESPSPSPANTTAQPAATGEDSPAIEGTGSFKGAETVITETVTISDDDDNGDSGISLATGSIMNPIVVVDTPPAGSSRENPIDVDTSTTESTNAKKRRAAMEDAQQVPSDTISSRQKPRLQPNKAANPPQSYSRTVPKTSKPQSRTSRNVTSTSTKLQFRATKRRRTSKQP